MTNNNAIWRMDAQSLTEAILRGDFTCREATQSVLDRLAEVNPHLNAVTVVHAEEALAAADRADEARRNGDPVGPLHGVPTTIKEGHDQEGTANTGGVVALRNNVARSDSPAVRAWRKAGAIFVGRTNMPSFGLRLHTDNELRGPTFNPWDRFRTPGGSSGGAAAAVAAGIGPIANASDLGGSIRFPAYCNGIVGIRPGHARVAHYNLSAAQERPVGMQTMSVQGPVARTVSDLRLSLRLMIEEEDFGDPRWAPVPFIGAPIAGAVRVALPRNVGTLHADVAQAIDAAAKALVDAGYAVEEVDVPNLEAAGECFAAICVSEMRHLLQGTMRQLGGPQMTRTLDLYLEINKDIGLDGYVKALANRAVFVREWAKFLAKYPLVLMPASTQPPFVVGFDLYDVNVARASLQAIRPLMASSLVGMPAAIVPVGVYNGLPIGVQIVGQKFREDLCLDAAEAIEQRRGVLTPIDPKF